MNHHDHRPEPYELADAMPHIVWTHDPGGAVTYFNRRWVEYTGLSLAESLATGPSSLVHPDDLDAVLAILGPGHGDAPGEATYRLRRADGAWRWHSGRVVPVRASDGSVAYFVGTAVDIDDQRRLSDTQRFLVRASAVLGTSLDLQQTLGDVARLVVPHMADWFAIDLLDAQGRAERLAVAHVDPSKVALAREIWERLPPRPEDDHGFYAVVRTGRAEVFEDIPDALLEASIPDPSLLSIFRSLGLRSSMCVPLVARDHTLGTLSLVSAESGRRYDADDLAFAEEFSRRIAITIDNARLYGEATASRDAARAMADDLVEQSHAVERALLTMRAERDAARARLAALEASEPTGG